VRPGGGGSSYSLNGLLGAAVYLLASSISSLSGMTYDLSKRTQVFVGVQCLSIISLLAFNGSVEPDISYSTSLDEERGTYHPETPNLCLPSPTITSSTA